jgi:hypothetical protein
MTASVFPAGWAGAVVLGLYAFHCFWEAGRADLCAMSRDQRLQLAPAKGQPPRATPAAYRARACLALVVSGALALGVLFLAH